MKQDNSNIKVLIPTGYGLNCEEEAAYAFKMVGATVHKIFINEILENPRQIDNYHVIFFIGGFSDGDHLGAGVIHANRLRVSLDAPLYKFIEDGKLVIGVCNGFQALAKAGILPGTDGDYRSREITLAANSSGVFIDRWVTLGVNPNSKSVWTEGITPLNLPIRHGEGRLVVANDEVLKKIKRNEQDVLFYINPETGKRALETEFPHNPNGSIGSIAAICNSPKNGFPRNVLGMMPHPEAYLSPFNHPSWTRQKRDGTLPNEGMGIQLFRNAVRYAAENLVINPHKVKVISTL